MATNEERRKVAEKLRKYGSKKYPNFNLAYLYAAMGLDFIDVMEHKFTDAELYAKLADLIDPDQEHTCKFIPSGEVDGIRYEQCSNCGADFELEVVRAFFNYCPNCGARVVNDGD